MATTGIDDVPIEVEADETGSGGKEGAHGLVRILYIDPSGPFAKSNPIKRRLRVGGVILAVNGTPVDSARAALKAIMLGQDLTEVLHCDERVWREDWLHLGLDCVLSGGKNDDIEGDTTAIYRDVEALLTNKEQSESAPTRVGHGWKWAWSQEREEATLISTLGFAFKIKFNEKNGTCHSAPVEYAVSSFPPASNFRVDLFVAVINALRRVTMRLLLDMVKRSKFEAKLASIGNMHHSQDWREIKRRTTIDQLVAPQMGERDHGTVARYGGDRRRSTEGNMTVQSNNLQSANRLPAGQRQELLKPNPIHEHENDRPAWESSYSKSSEGTIERKQPSHLGRDDRTQVALSEREELAYRVGLPRTSEWGSQGISQDTSSERSNSDPVSYILPTSHQISGHERFTRNKVKEDVDHSFLSQASTTSYASSIFSAVVQEDLPEDLDEMQATWTSMSDINTKEKNIPSLSRLGAGTIEDGTELPKGLVDYEKAYITGVLRDVNSKYDILVPIIGSGGFGQVRDCINRATGQVYAIKSILKPARDKTSKVNLIRNEVLLLHQVDHPNIIELKDLFEDEQFVHIVMERCTGGDLFDQVVRENAQMVVRTYSERIKHEARTANIVRSILDVVKYLHSMYIVHRDIKPEHFLWSTDKRSTQKIKLIDFGLARKHEPYTDPMQTFTGSPAFVAPEVIFQNYSNMCDMFSVGVTSFFLLTGMLPFDASTAEETFDKISAGQFSFPPSSIVHLSDDAQDFLTLLLKNDPKERLSAEKALNHPWILKAARKAVSR